MKKTDSAPSPQTTHDSRREFMRRTLFGGFVVILGGMGLVTAWRGRHGQTTSACAQSFRCGTCPTLNRCDLDEGVAFRDTQTDGDAPRPEPSNEVEDRP